MNSTQLLVKMATSNDGICRGVALIAREETDVHAQRFWHATKMSLYESIRGDLEKVDPAIGLIVTECFNEWVDWETVFNAMIEAGESSLACRPAAEWEGK